MRFVVSALVIELFKKAANTSATCRTINAEQHDATKKKKKNRKPGGKADKIKSHNTREGERARERQ